MTTAPAHALAIARNAQGELALLPALSDMGPLLRSSIFSVRSR